jgi:hypothetical protein
MDIWSCVLHQSFLYFLVSGHWISLLLLQGSCEDPECQPLFFKERCFSGATGCLFLTILKSSGVIDLKRGGCSSSMSSGAGLTTRELAGNRPVASVSRVLLSFTTAKCIALLYSPLLSICRHQTSQGCLQSIYHFTFSKHECGQEKTSTKAHSREKCTLCSVQRETPMQFVGLTWRLS